MVTAIDGYPFEAMTERFSYRSRVKCNWKIVLGRLPGVLSRARPARGAIGSGRSRCRARGGLRGAALRDRRPAPHAQRRGSPALDHASRGVQADGAVDPQRPVRGWDAPELPGPLPAGVNPGKCDPWGLSSFQIWPNLVILIWNLNWFHVIATGLAPTTRWCTRRICSASRPGPRGSGSLTRWQPSPTRSSGCRTRTRSRRLSPCSSRG